jgi:hypothetical protein
MDHENIAEAEGIFNTVSIFFNSFLPPLDKSMYLLPNMSCSHTFAATDAWHTAAPGHPHIGVSTGSFQVQHR